MFRRCSYVALVVALSELTGSPVGAESFFGSQDCAIIAASRSKLTEARQWIYQNNFEDQAYVYLSQNGWYAIALGTVAKSEARAVIERGVRLGNLPSDAYCSTGSQYIQQMDWRTADLPRNSHPAVT